MADSTFGRRILGQSPDVVLELERVHDAKVSFPELDTITSEIVLAALSGARVAVLARAEWRTDLDRTRAGLQLPVLTGQKRDAVSDVFTFAAQQARGAWYLPEDATVCTGNANLPYYSARYPRFAVGVARDERARVGFDGPDALYFWAVLDPLFAELFRPFYFRGPSPPKGDAAAQQDAWREIDVAYAALGIDGGEPLVMMRYGGRWGRLHSAEQLTTKQALLEQLRRTMHGNVGARYRSWASGELVAKYYAKAKQVQPLMRLVLSKPVQRTHAAFFGGDWLAFLHYLGEDPNPEEQISVALPEPRLYVKVPEHTAAVAVKHGVPAAEVERILATFWKSETPTSPVHRRLDVLRAFWQHFDAEHARQAPGMPSLYGFLGEGEEIGLPIPKPYNPTPDWCHPGSYRQLLPAALLTDIEELWGGLFPPDHPDHIVSAPDPYRRMSETFGVALRFWHEAALTAWFVSEEGPYWYTDMFGLANYHARDLKQLDTLGCPLDHELFAELIEAEKRLGPAKRGSPRAGFEQLRDVLTRRRRHWANRYLEAYFRGRWETELREAAREYNKLCEVKRKAPTLKQFAKFAEEPTNHWFGGDVSQLYRAIGEDAPGMPVRTCYLREAASTFAMRVFVAFGGKFTRLGDPEWDYKHVQLANRSIHYVQLREALGRAPTLKQFGELTFLDLATTLDPSLASLWKDIPVDGLRARLAYVTPAWERYSAVIEGCLGDVANG